MGFYFLPRPFYIELLLGLLVLELSIEYLRLKNKFIHSWFRQHFPTVFREEEWTRLSGIPWMTLGILATALLLPPPQLAATVVLYLVFGDGVASLAGKSMGGHHWPSSKKRISGSGACLLVCLGVGLFMLRPDYGWAGIWLGALVTAVFEIGFIPLNDNFLLPIVGSLTLKFIYGI